MEEQTGKQTTLTYPLHIFYYEIEENNINNNNKTRKDPIEQSSVKTIHTPQKNKQTKKQKQNKTTTTTTITTKSKTKSESETIPFYEKNSTEPLGYKIRPFWPACNVPRRSCPFMASYCAVAVGSPLRQHEEGVGPN